ncbi:MAG: hypothetical protein K2L67_01815 [Clostridia bacterium]|nr:hypothetical protein [Clostridia bacterium]
MKSGGGNATATNMPKTYESTFYTLPRGAERFGVPHLFRFKIKAAAAFAAAAALLKGDYIVMLSVKRNVSKIFRQASE